MNKFKNHNLYYQSENFICKSKKKKIFEVIKNLSLLTMFLTSSFLKLFEVELHLKLQKLEV